MRSRGMNVLIANSDIDRQREVMNLELFQQSRVAGIIITPLDTPSARADGFPISSTPTVLVNFESASDAYTRGRGRRATRRRTGGRSPRQPRPHQTAVRRWPGLPHRRSSAARRSAGRGRAHGRGHHRNARDGRAADPPRAELVEIIERGAGRYDGIVAASDLLAMGLVQSLSAHQGFARAGGCRHHRLRRQPFRIQSTIPITTVGQPGKEMGRIAADLLMARVREPGSPTRAITLEPHLIPRASTLGDASLRD